MSTASPQQYRSAFELFNDGQAVLNDLVERFGKDPFTPGQPDVTAHKLGQKSVVEFIWSQIARTQE